MVEKQRNLGLEPSEAEIFDCDMFLIGFDRGSRQGRKNREI